MIRPLSDNVVIRRFEAEEKTKGGIILTSANKEVPQTAEAVSYTHLDYVGEFGEFPIFGHIFFEAHFLIQLFNFLLQTGYQLFQGCLLYTSRCV